MGNIGKQLGPVCAGVRTESTRQHGTLLHHCGMCRDPSEAARQPSSERPALLKCFSFGSSRQNVKARCSSCDCLPWKHPRRKPAYPAWNAPKDGLPAEKVLAQ